ncbi:hypothetical protein DSO57_1035955 [Entomophthora muscae]|uniref:Uncharacterized protein n=1 Tax=Entomophthora muscae TaxID=34485 RepID=A0ACC2TLI4_9FUNG|nr:hypothetical protein DSO57_1035955 [Entomophthora muscae]
MILFGKEAPHISMSVSATTKPATSFDVLPLCLSHLHAAFDSKVADGLPTHSQFDFEFKLTVDLVKVASPIYPLNLKEEQCLEEWTKDRSLGNLLLYALHCCLFKSLMDHYAPALILAT